jgi:peptidoglycan/LPS O-acetylase OafA/YrhL
MLGPGTNVVATSSGRGVADAGTAFHRVPQIESLRGFAALYVFVGHMVVSLDLLRGAAAMPFKFGGEIVMLFFLVSGFVVMLSVVRAPHLTFPAYLRKRFTRIYPIFLLSLAVGYLVTREMGLDLPTLLGNIFMLQDYTQAKPGTLFSTYRNPALWSLSYEWWFYLMFWPILRGVPEHRQLGFVTAVGMVAAVLYTLAEFQPLLFVALFPTWWWGAEMGRDVARTGSPRMRRILFAAGWTVACWALIVAATALRSRSSLSLSVHPVLELRQVGITMVYLAIVALFTWPRTLGFLRRMRPFHILAPISYGLYALHAPMVLLVSEWPAVAPVRGVVCVALALSLAFVAERLWQPAAKAGIDRMIAVFSRSRWGRTA